LVFLGLCSEKGLEGREFLFGAFNILQGSLRNNHPFMASCMCVHSRTVCFFPKMAISEKILILFRSPLNGYLSFLCVNQVPCRYIMFFKILKTDIYM
jgi:hypothetical protein